MTCWWDPKGQGGLPGSTAGKPLVPIAKFLGYTNCSPYLYLFCICGNSHSQTGNTHSHRWPIESQLRLLPAGHVVS